MDTQLLYGIVLTAAPILVSLSVHEFAHARTALAFGDTTAKAMGRCTLNPLAHLHPIGTLMIVFVGFGWAKPVPVNNINLHPRRLGSLAVSLAGPASNLAIAVGCAITLRILAAAGMAIRAGGTPGAPDLAVFLLTFLIFINIILCVFNLIPLYPLDGHHIGRELLPTRSQGGYMQWQRQYGMWLFMALWIGPTLLRGSLGVTIDPLGAFLGRSCSPPCRSCWGLKR